MTQETDVYPISFRSRYTMSTTVTTFLLCLLVMSSPCKAALEFLGNVQSTTIAANRVDLTFAQEAVSRIEMLNSDLLRVRINPSGTLTSWKSPAIEPTDLIPPGTKIFNTAKAVFLISADMTVVVFKAPFRVVILRPDNTTLLADAELAVGIDADTGVIFNQKLAPSDEHYFGFGMRGGPIDRRGRNFLMFNTDSFAFGEFDDPLYLSIPFYYGIRDGRAYGVLVDTSAAPFFNVNADGSNTLTFGAADGELNYYVMAGPETSRVANTYARLTGFTPLPPKWALGYQQSRVDYTSQQQLLDLASTFRTLKIPCDALYLDLFYKDALQLFTWDPVNFPTPIKMNASLEASGFKRVNIFDPFIIREDSLWKLLDDSKYLLTDAETGDTFLTSTFLGTGGWIDFTKDAARTWYAEVMKAFLSTGVSAVWDDLNEPAQNDMPTAVYDFHGQPRIDLHARNFYALAQTSLSYSVQKELRPAVRPWGLSRSGYAGIQRYAANWSGDTLTSFDSLRVSIQISTSMGLSGQNFFGHDIGGFLGSPSSELFIRWLQFASYTGLFRNHAVYWVAPREPWQFGEPYTSIIKKTIEQRYRLLPYTYTWFERASRDASPVLAPTVYHFPSDTQTYRQNYEFMWGPYFLVAPVFTQGATTRSVYLPSGGDWIDYNTERVYAGGQTVTVPAPLGTIPLFVREGAIIPSGPLMQYVTEPVPPELTVDVYPGPDGSFTLYEDDGESFAYTSGGFLRTRLSQRREPGARRVSIKRIEGRWTPPKRPWWVRFHGVPTAPVAVKLNGVALAQVPTKAKLASVSQGWFYDSQKDIAVVKFPDSSATLRVEVRS